MFSYIPCKKYAKMFSQLESRLTLLTIERSKTWEVDL
jgi:hypothetical protein